MSKRSFLLAASLLLSGPLHAQSRPIAFDQLDGNGGKLSLPGASNAKAASLFSLEWHQHEIPVCWVNPAPEDEAQRQRLRSAVYDIWESAADLRLTGWGTCQSGQSAVRIVVSSDEWPRAIIGRNALSATRPTMWLNFHMASHPGFSGCVDKEERCITFASVHEFGHMLGLIHEQDRPDTPADCINSLAPSQRREPPAGDLHLLTGYDPNSLMNYCSKAGYNPAVPLALSPDDRVAIVKLFGEPRPSEPPQPEKPNPEPKPEVKPQPQPQPPVKPRRRPDLPVYDPN